MSESYGNCTVQVREWRVTVVLTLEFKKRRFLVLFLQSTCAAGRFQGNRKFIYLAEAAEVSDVGTSAPPSNPLFFGGPLRIEQRSHSLRIQAAALHQVDDCEAVAGSSLHVADPEVKPLRVLPGVHVSTQRELVLVRTPDRGGKERAVGQKQSRWERL